MTGASLISIVFSVVASVSFWYTYHTPLLAALTLSLLAYMSAFTLVLYWYLYDYLREDKVKYELIENYFGTRDVKKEILRYERDKKILFILIPILSASTVFNFTFSFSFSLPLFHRLGYSILAFSLFYLSNFGIIFAVYLVLLRLTKPIVWRKHFSFYLAKISIEIALRELDEDTKMYYLQYGINCYNIYLQKALRLQIKDVSRVYDKIMRASVEEKDVIIEKFIKSLQRDRLDLVRELAILPPDEERKEDSHSKQEGESFLIEQKFGQRIKELSAAIIPLVTTIISIISLLFKFGY
jgi:hypothetical protein